MQLLEVKSKFISLAVKLAMRARLFQEKLKPRFRRDQKFIDNLELAIESPEVVEFVVSHFERGIDDLIDQSFGESEITAESLDVAVREFGDGSLLKIIIDYLKSGGLEDILKFIIGIIGAIGGISSTATSLSTITSLLLDTTDGFSEQDLDAIRTFAEGLKSNNVA